ncbi:MAG: HAD family hydrolase [Candidatus Lokiarchaeota archaeon]
MTLKAIIWDLDGTLIHFKIDFIRARKEALKILDDYRVPKDLLSLSKSIIENVKISKQYLRSKDVSESEVSRMGAKVNSKVSEIEYEAALQATQVDNIDTALEFAKENGLKQAIYTFNTHRNAQTSLEKVNLLTYFDVIVGRDDVDNPKPHMDHIFSICKKLNVKPQNCVVIGDTSNDIEGAINVGAYSVAINTKIPDSFKSQTFEKADFYIEESQIPDKLIEAIKKLLE